MIRFGTPHRTPPKPEIAAKCLVHFRPKNDWLGEEYGFDWMRDDDTNLITGSTSFFGDTKYEGIVAKQYKEAAFTNLVTDINQYNGFYKKSPTLYSSLKSEYTPNIIPWKVKKDAAGADLRDRAGVTIKEDYFCPWLSLFPKEIEKTIAATQGHPAHKVKEASNFANTIAKLSFILDVEEEADTLKFEANPNFTITPQEITITGKARGKHAFVNAVTIECLKEFTTDQIIVIKAVKKGVAPAADEVKIAGKLNVWANHKPRRKTAKVVLVEIATPEIVATKGPRTGNSAGQKELFERYLRQALIDTTVDTIVLNVTTDTKLQTGGIYVDGGKIRAYYNPILNPAGTAYIKNTREPAGFVDLQTYLYTKLKAQLRAVRVADEHKFDNYYVAYYLAEDGGFANAAGILQELNGFSSEKKVMLFPGKNDQTAAHEFLHSFNLPHSFTNKESADEDVKNARTPAAKVVAGATTALFTFEYAKTENLMDYSHRIGKTRSSLWKWQWKKANSSVR